MTRRYNEALRYATEKHAGQKRIGGEAYITHPMAVAALLRDSGYSEDYQIAGLFHDLLEDTDATEAEILERSNEQVLAAVKLLTKAPGYVMADYVEGIRKNTMAKAVKAADRLHNLRSAVCADAEFKRKYILESVDWYLDFSKEIPPAVKALAQTLDTPLTELPFLYKPVDSWLVNEKKGETDDDD